MVMLQFSQLLCRDSDFTHASTHALACWTPELSAAIGLKGEICCVAVEMQNQQLANMMQDKLVFHPCPSRCPLQFASLEPR